MKAWEFLLIEAQTTALAGCGKRCPGKTLCVSCNTRTIRLLTAAATVDRRMSAAEYTCHWKTQHQI